LNWIAISLTLFGIGQARGDDVEEEDGDAGVREVRGDAAPHDARADDGHAADRLHAFEIPSG
jgi:hypothetical protein